MNSFTIHNEYAKLSQVTMHYLDTKTTGETLLCIHGLWGRADTWKSFMKAYGNRYRVIAVDLRGHGYTDKPNTPYTPEVMCNDIDQLMNHLGIESAIVLGHSQGGRIGAHLAFHHPERVKQLAILDKSAAGLPPDTLVDNSVSHKDPLTHDWPLHFKTLEAARSYILDAMDDALSYGYFMLSLTETKDGYTMLFDQNAIGSLKAHDLNWFHILPEIKCPTLLMRTSSHEAISDADWENMIRLLPDCTPVEMAHPSHNVMISDTEAFYGFIDGFIGK